MREFYPHYLGERPKYTRSATLIETSGMLPGAEIQYLHQIFDDRLKQHTPVGTYKFKNDRTLDEPSLTGRSGVNYWSLLLENVHFTNNE